MSSSLRRGCVLLTSCRFFSSRTASAAKLVQSKHKSDTDLVDMTINDYVWRNLDRWPDHTAIVCAATGRSYTYKEARRMSGSFARALVKAGYRPGQVISMVLPNCPEYPIALLGALEAGLIVSTINPIYASEEIGYQISNSGTSCVVTFPEKVGAVQMASKGLPVVVVGKSVPGTFSFMEMSSSKDGLDSRLSSDVHGTALLPYSSGTTGLPKGVCLSHHNIISNNIQIGHKDIRFVQETTKEHQDVIPCVLPFFHIYGLSVTMISYLAAGSKLVTVPRFEPETFLKVLKDYKSTIAHVVPPLVQFMGSHPAVTKAHLDTLRACINGAAPVGLVDVERLVSKKPHTFVSGYGLTETSPVITSAVNTCKDYTTVGGPLSFTEMKIVHTETGDILDPGETGEICCRGPQVMKGYHNNEKATNETIKDGWLHTGDVGYFDENGDLRIVDRIKELIKVKGFQVAPLELEQILKSHSSVVDVAVVGKPDPKSGEVPVAFVVVKPGEKQPSTNELKTFVASKVVEYKQLDSVIFISSIPKNTTGKILRKELKESIMKG